MNKNPRILTRDWRTPILERRKARRFEVDWDVAIESQGGMSSGFDDTGRLQNLSSRGAFLYLNRPLEVGTKLQVSIRLPVVEDRWAKYWAEVIRVECSYPRIGIAMRFKRLRPHLTQRGSTK